MHIFVYRQQVVVYYATSEFLTYKSGVFSTQACQPGPKNHAVVLVGYGKDPKYGDYWLIRNSW